MKQRLTIIIAILIFLGVIALMLRDMYQRQALEQNPYDYSLDEFKEIETEQIGYKLVDHIRSDFVKMKAISIDSEDQIYIADSNKILCFGKDLKLKKSFDTDGEIHCVSAQTADRIYLGVGGSVEITDGDGKVLSKWEPFSNRSYITSLAITEDFIYVADAGAKLLLKYDKDGKFLDKFGAKNNTDRKFGFVIPSEYFDIAEGREGQIWAVNPGKHTFEAYNDSGTLISSWKKTSMGLDGFSGCCNPTHFAMLEDGAFVTTEKGLVRIKVHEPTGAFRTAVASAEDFNEKEVGMDIAINSEQEIFVIVPSEKEVRKYRKIGE